MVHIRLMLLAAGSLGLAGCEETAREGVDTMELSIPAFAAGEPIPVKFTCDGADRSPALQWSAPPANTRSLALIVDDPDAPRGIFGHWAAYDIDPGVRQLEEGAGNLAGTSFRQARNDFGVQHYKGPCPPRGHGIHRYRFRLFALDIAQLEAGPAPQISEIEQAMQGHVLGTASVTAPYARN